MKSYADLYGCIAEACRLWYAASPLQAAINAVTRCAQGRRSTRGHAEIRPMSRYSGRKWHARDLGGVARELEHPRPHTSPHWVAWSQLIRSIYLLLVAVAILGCNTFAPWDKPVREHCVCEREVDGTPEAGAHWIVMYVCSNESSEAAEEAALEWCDANLPTCIDCACESQGEGCSP